MYLYVGVGAGMAEVVQVSVLWVFDTDITAQVAAFIFGKERIAPRCMPKWGPR